MRKRPIGSLMIGRSMRTLLTRRSTFCNVHFCWLCGEKITEEDLYSHFWPSFSSSASLLFQGTAVDEDAPLEADEEALNWELNDWEVHEDALNWEVHEGERNEPYGDVDDAPPNWKVREGVPHREVGGSEPDWDIDEDGPDWASIVPNSLLLPAVISTTMCIFKFQYLYCPCRR